MIDSDNSYTGSVPQVYDAHLGPMFFSPYAEDIAERASARQARSVLEVACGTGIATAAVARALPRAQIVATDLNAAMLTVAASRSGLSCVRYSVADATALPFERNRFDLVLCQFGVMFFVDRVRAFREMLRVLATGGTLLFNVWDDLEHNDVSRIVSGVVAAAFPNDPPRFLERTPHGHSDPAPIRRDLAEAGFLNVTVETVEKLSFAPSALDAAIGLCEGTPLRNEILARDPQRLPEIVRAAARALEVALGNGPIQASMRAYVYTASSP